MTVRGSHTAFTFRATDGLFAGLCKIVRWRGDWPVGVGLLVARPPVAEILADLSGVVLGVAPDQVGPGDFCPAPERGDAGGALLGAAAQVHRSGDASHPGEEHLERLRIVPVFSEFYPILGRLPLAGCA